MIAEYQNTQKSIVTNLPLHLKANGYLLYITCSVFKQENEEVVEFIEKNCQMELVKQAVVHEQGGDYLFAALLTKKVDA